MIHTLLFVYVTHSIPPPSLQLAAQVLEDLKDEDIGFALLDAKKEKSVAKKLGKTDCLKTTPCFVSRLKITN